MIDKLQEIKGYAREKKTRALINTDSNAYKAYKQTRDASVQINKVQAEVSSLKKDFKEIKQLLQQLVTGMNNGNNNSNSFFISSI